MELTRFRWTPERLGSPARSWLILSDFFPEVLAKLGPEGGSTRAKPGSNRMSAGCLRTLELDRREIAKCRVPPSKIVEALDEVEDRDPRLALGAEADAKQIPRCVLRGARGGSGVRARTTIAATTSERSVEAS